MKYPKFSHKTPHLKGKQHQLDPNLDLKQLVHHATVQYVDRDADGDVDIYDNPKKKTPDENVSSAQTASSSSKKLIVKQKGELKHTKRGMAYEDLGNWFDKDHPEGNWKRYNTKGEAIGPCAREPGEPKPKCLSNEKAAKMSKNEIAAAVKRKREKDPVADRKGKGGKPVMSSNEIEEGILSNVVDKLKGRKKIGTTASGGGIYVSTRKSKPSKVRYKESPKPATKKSVNDDPWSKGAFSADDRRRVNLDLRDVKEDHEHSMARSELATIEKAVKRLKTKMKGEGNIEAWVQSKITKAADYIDSAADYLDSGEHNSEESVDEAKCWKGYKRKPGTKEYEKGSCVKEGGLSFEISPKHREVQRDTKIRKRTQTGDEGSKIALKKVKGPNAPLVKPGDTKIRNMYSGYEPSLVDKILLEMEAEVLTEKNKPTNPKLWAKWKAKAKAKFDVYPSAYANGWAVKGYKSEGGGWESVNEDITIEDADGNTFAEIIDLVVHEEHDGEEKYCKKCKKNEKRSECKYGPETWDKMTEDDDDEDENENLKEAVRIPAKTGNILMVNLTWRGKYYGVKLFFPHTKMPNRREVQDEVDKIYPGAKVYSYKVSDFEPGQPIVQVTEEKKTLNDPIRTPGEKKKFKVYVKNPSTGNIATVRFGDPNMEIKRDDPKRLKAFRSRHGCDTPKAKNKLTAKYWSCYQWRKGKKVNN